MSVCVVRGNSTLLDKIVAYTKLYLNCFCFSLYVCVVCVHEHCGILTASRCEEVREGCMLLNDDSLEFDTDTPFRFEKFVIQNEDFGVNLNTQITTDFHVS